MRPVVPVLLHEPRVVQQVHHRVVQHAGDVPAGVALQLLHDVRCHLDAVLVEQGRHALHRLIPRDLLVGSAHAGTVVEVHGGLLRLPSLLVHLHQGLGGAEDLIHDRHVLRGDLPEALLLAEEAHQTLPGSGSGRDVERVPVAALELLEPHVVCLTAQGIADYLTIPRGLQLVPADDLSKSEGRVVDPPHIRDRPVCLRRHPPRQLADLGVALVQLRVDVLCELQVPLCPVPVRLRRLRRGHQLLHLLGTGGHDGHHLRDVLHAQVVDVLAQGPQLTLQVHVPRGYAPALGVRPGCQYAALQGAVQHLAVRFGRDAVLLRQPLGGRGGGVHVP